MSSSSLKWVYGPTHRAQDVSNEAVDEYKSIIQQLYLDQNKTREEVLSHLQDVHGFSLSTNQFSKATKRWGFYKQPRQVRTNVRSTESITKAEAAPEPPNSLEELFDFQPDHLDTIDKTEACFETGGENIADSWILETFEGPFSYTRRYFVSEPVPSINDWSEAMSVDFLCDGRPCDVDKSLPESSKGELQQLETVPKLETGSHSMSPEMLTKVFLDNQINQKKSRVDYLTCCYLFEEAVYCLENLEKSLDEQEYRVLSGYIGGPLPLTQYRRDKDKLLASPDTSLNMWSILCLIEPYRSGIPDDLLDRLDTNDSQFMNAVDACLELCKKWIELVISGLPRGALQFDSLLLHRNASKAVQNICRPLREQSRFDIWQEAGYLFAFVWSNEQRETVDSSSWLKGAKISGLSPTHFLAVMCRIIVHETALKYPAFWPISGKAKDADKFICWLYLQAIKRIKGTKKLRSLKKRMITCLFMHHAGSDIDLEEKTSLQNVQSYQRRAEDFVLGNNTDTLTQEVRQALLSHRDIRMSASSLYFLSYSDAHQQFLTYPSGNPAMTRSLASGSSRGSSLNSFRAFQAASRAMETCLKEDQSEYI